MERFEGVLACSKRTEIDLFRANLRLQIRYLEERYFMAALLQFLCEREKGIYVMPGQDPCCSILIRSVTSRSLANPSSSRSLSPSIFTSAGLSANFV